MAASTADISTKIATEGVSPPEICRAPKLIQPHTAAHQFVESYYPALQSGRSTLASYYVQSSSLQDDKTPPTMVFNGNLIPDPQALQVLFQTQMPQAHYEVQSYDAHVLNPNYVLAGAGRNDLPPGKAMSIVLTVSGYVRYGESRDAAMRGFSETIILVPSGEGPSGRTRSSKKKEWLIQSQNFRLVV